MDEGSVHAVGGGTNDNENRITSEPSFFSRLKSITRGYAYAIGPSRKVFKRTAPNQWLKLDNGFPSALETSDETGFDDIDGFSDSDIYACGDNGDLWHFNGNIWRQIETPTNADLWKVCCGEDGKVYILTDSDAIIIGRNDQWEIITQDETDDILEDIVWYKDRIYISTEAALFEISEGEFKPAELTPPQQDSYANLASGDGILLVAGIKEACFYDGENWTKIA